MNDDYWYNQDHPQNDNAASGYRETPSYGAAPDPGATPAGAPTPPASGYSYVRPDSGWGYTDAGYIPRQEAPAPPRYNPYQAPPKTPKPKREKKGVGFGKILAACLICALLGGLIGGGIIYFTGQSTTTASDRGSAANEATPAPTFNYTSSPAAPSVTSQPNNAASSEGTTMTGAQIYSMGCVETVGVTTNITTQNVFGQTSQASVIGSGFIIRSDGYILTNYHVVSDAYQGGYQVNVILYNGDKYDAKIVGVEPDNDIAVLQIDTTNLPAVTIGDSDGIAVGEPVYAIGNPLGELTYTMTTGIVSALNREITTDSSGTSINMFQIDAAVNEGNSGGPVFDGTGSVIGITTAKYSDTGVEGLGFAIPINDAMNIASSLIQNGYVPGKPNLGITVTTVDQTTASYYNMVVGAFVRSVNAGSCAEKAGIKTGDIITKVDNTDITSNSDLVNAKNTYKAGDSAVFTVYRNGQYLQLTVTFDEATPATPGTANTQSPAPADNGQQNLFPGFGG
ncbi:MAG: trypsin-like peptidase domain-containing protein [Firmicutes bacterium]|nr:trypsin-like peptidase domain-containing protein [Bacillota bacterium]